eukprot:m.64403 g.64403  ORF g.64403 m.64403 type:complete len:53 (-) comp11484_c0_seq1:785-943(-)
MSASVCLCVSVCDSVVIVFVFYFKLLFLKVKQQLIYLFYCVIDKKTTTRNPS